MRWLIGAAVVVFILAAGGTALEMSQRRAPGPAAVTASDAPLGVIQHVDGTGRVTSSERYVTPAATPTTAGRITTYATLWVNEGAYLLAEKAATERDEKTTRWAEQTYEHFGVSYGTQVRVLTRAGSHVHLELPNGKRGWTSAAAIGP